MNDRWATFLILLGLIGGLILTLYGTSDNEARDKRLKFAELCAGLVPVESGIKRCARMEDLN